MNESDIGGCEIKFSVRFNQNDNHTYLDKVSELLDDIADIVEKRGHDWLVSCGKPIGKDEVN